MPQGKTIKDIYRKAGFKPPKGKHEHTAKFHRCAVAVAKKNGGNFKMAYPICMKSIGKEKAVNKSHQR